MAVLIPKADLVGKDNLIRFGHVDMFPVFSTTKLQNIYLLRRKTGATTYSQYIFDHNDGDFSTEYIPLGSAVGQYAISVKFAAANTAKVYVFQSFDGVNDDVVTIENVPAQGDTNAGDLRDWVQGAIFLPYFKYRIILSAAGSLKSMLVLAS